MMQKISARKKKFLLFDLFLFIVLVLLDQFTKYHSFDLPVFLLLFET